MAAILPDEIRDINQMSDNEKVGSMYEYIKYMHEQLEFWGSNLNKKLLIYEDNFQILQEEIEAIIEYLEEKEKK